METQKIYNKEVQAFLDFYAERFSSEESLELFDPDFDQVFKAIAFSCRFYEIALRNIHDIYINNIGGGEAQLRALSDSLTETMKEGYDHAEAVTREVEEMGEVIPFPGLHIVEDSPSPDLN